LHHLPEFGYSAKVLTTSAFGGESSDRVLRAWEPLGLYRRLFNKEVRSGETASYVRTDAGLLRSPLQWAYRYLLVPDLQLTWLPAALLKALRAVRRDPPDVLYSTYPPASAHLLALLLKGLTGMPWVADFRDAWVYDPLDPVLEEVPYRRALEKFLEEAVVVGADRVLAATEISAAYLRQTYPQAADTIEVIPNGFEPDDFPGDGRGPRRSGQDPLRIVHTGSFSRSHPKRTPQPLFVALEALLDEDPSWASRLCLVLVGHLTSAEQAAARRLERAGVVEIRGPLERGEALACQRQADVLLLVDHARNGLASNVPGKFYEYLAVRRPILALCGAGMVERLVGELGAGFHAAVDDPQAIGRKLKQIYGLFQRNQLEVRVDEVILRRFHRRELTRKLALCFDQLTGDDG
jgi:glycosyltransferase involved in cell wall biosynthesis